ncbi:MAG: T9SS type A sorting domain-containing protein [Bacteroidetes bacterium]|nr:T9SS type A sorting domain-containing protein [Bacteroidota bacterium]
MIKQLPLILRTFKVLTFVLLFSLSGISQEETDNPNLDQIPKWYLDQTQSQQVKAAQVITIDDYDNFFLGVDFAESHITSNPTDPTQFYAAFNIDARHGSLDGYNWYDSPPVSWGATIRGDVVLAYDSQGRLYYENMYGSSSILGCKVVVSDDNGQTWGSVVTAISGVDKNWIAADQTDGPYSNYVYTVMTSGGGGNFARSTNLGASFSNTYTFGTQSLPGMMVCVGPNDDVQGGTVYVVTNGGNTFGSTYSFYRSHDGGSTFQFMSSQNFPNYVGSNVNGRHSVENMRTRPYPFITADNSDGPYRGRFYCVYASNQPVGNGNKPDVWLRYSDNEGSTWSSPIQVNDDPNTTQNHQFAPAPWCDLETGRLYIQWMDTRDCPTSDSAMIYGTYSDMGGEEFMPNVAISNEKMKINCTSCGASGSPRYQGDYNGITSNSKTSMSVWTDFRYGSFASFVGYMPDFAMRVFPEEKEITYQDTIWAVVPDVKLYDDTCIFSATIADPPSGSFSIDFPMGTTLTAFPDSLPVVITADNVPLGDYYLEVKGEGPNGTPVHYREATLILDELPLPIVEFTAEQTEVCTGHEVHFMDETQFFPTQWFWSFEGGSPATSEDQNPVVTYSEPGTYDVTLFAVNGTGFNELTKTDYMTVSVAPEMPEGDDVFACLPGLIPPLEVTGDEVTWYDDEALTNIVNTGNVYETGLTEPGTYLFYVTQFAGGCESLPLEISLHINLQPEATLDPLNDVCDTEPAFNLTGGLPGGGYYIGPGVTDNMFDPAVAGAGIHSIGYVYMDENQCSDTAYQDMTVNASPVFELGADTAICANLTYTLDATAEGAETYLWSPGGETTPSIEVDSAGTGLASQEYMVVVTGTNGCARTDAVTITFQDCAGVGEINGLQSVVVFPNPNDGVFSLKLNSTKRIQLDAQLISAAGKEEFSKKGLVVNGSFEQSFELTGLQAGVYYLTLTSKDGKMIKKVLIK